jgi:uncharacterized membrane protein
MAHRLSVAPGFMIGVALAGFFDGIVLHQILQWHHMICVEAHCAVKSVDTLQWQNFTDGLFHAVMLLVLVAGLCLFVRAAQRGAVVSPWRFWGSALFGGGVFNVVEGIVDHHILQIHHVRFGVNQPVWDLGFLVVSTLLAAVGWIIMQRDDRAPGSTTTIRGRATDGGELAI